MTPKPWQLAGSNLPGLSSDLSFLPVSGSLSSSSSNSPVPRSPISASPNNPELHSRYNCPVRRIFIFTSSIFALFIFLHPVFAATPVTTITPAPTTTSKTGLPMPSNLTPTTSVTPLPTIPVPTATDNPCPNDGSVYPPNSQCFPTVKEIEKQIEKYPLSCISAPNVTYQDIYHGNNPPTSIDITVTHDISQAQLGGYGPDVNTMQNAASPDVLSRSYLFNTLFDKPFYSLDHTPREAWRTFWRLLNSYEQANVKSAYLNSIGGQHKSVTWHYLDKNGNDQVTNDKQLRKDISGGFAGNLPSWLFNLLKITPPDCLLKQPVCPEYASVYLALNDKARAEYDSLQPFDFDNIRAYIVLGGQIAKENIPYIQAVLSGISGKMGLFSNLTPNWAVKNPPKLPTTNNESTLLGKILAKASTVTCTTPTKVSGLPAPRTYPTISAVSQTVTVPLSATLVSRQPSYCDGQNFYCSYFHSISSCVNFGCSWHQGEKIYQIKGQATGKPLAVLNNPQVDQVTDMVLGGDGVPSFFNMMLPAFAQTPDKRLIDAPSVNNTVNNPNAAVSGASVIWRENNLAQDSMEILQSCWAMPASGQRSFLCGTKKATQEGPFECPTDCAKTQPDAAYAMGLKAKFTDLATRWLGVGTPQLQNYDTVVNSAVAAGVDPVFALTEWLNESDASNYNGICQKLGGGDPGSGYCNRVLDFGINLTSIASNPSTGDYHFSEQLSNFLGLPNFYKSACAAQMQQSQCPMRNFMAMFLVGQCTPNAASDGYYSHIKMLYEQWLAPGLKFPCYPTTYP